MSLNEHRVSVTLSILGIGLLPIFAPLVADDRSTELFLYRCSNRLGRRDITLFANGTVRQRQGTWEQQQLYLDELLPEELRSYVAQLGRIQAAADPLQTQLPGSAPSGEWVEECEIHLSLPAKEPETWSFSEFQVTPLVVSRLIHLAEDLASYTRAPAVEEGVPAEYQPRRGDVLRAVDGGRFRVINLTADGLAVELEGLDAPLRIFVPLGEIGTSFSRLEAQGDQ